MFAPEINSVAARGQPIRLYYTGLDINATAGSRAGWAVSATTSDSEIKVGSVVILDPFGHDKGQGIDCTRPNATYFRQRAFVVVGIPLGQPDPNAFDTGSALTNKRVGGWVEVVACANSVDAWVKVNLSSVAVMPLGFLTNSFCFGAPADTGTTAFDSTIEVCAFKAIAQNRATVDLSTTPALTRVQLGLFI